MPKTVEMNDRKLLYLKGRGMEAVCPRCGKAHELGDKCIKTGRCGHFKYYCQEHFYATSKKA